MKYRIKQILISIISMTIAVVCVMAKGNVFRDMGIPQIEGYWFGYTIGVTIFSIMALLSLSRAIKGKSTVKKQCKAMKKAS